ncbi:hypothetical protein [Paractinoplanes maris]|uniref:hypothetical protein n=1 Tax=Paractinoplanes maris TaxID=1734446 RepID=UPI0020202D0C|nr:hypothetical protein [Actinoplanes maris]
MNGDHEAVTDLAHLLDQLDDKIRTSDATIRRSEKNRLSLLHVHALFGCLIAPLFAALGHKGMAGPTWTVARLIPGAPYTLAAILFLGGVILAVATWYRIVKWEIVGLWILMAWYSIIAASFAGAVFVWLAAGSPAGARPSFYPAAVYSHVLVILLVHQNTLLRIRRARRKASR